MNKRQDLSPAMRAALIILNEAAEQGTATEWWRRQWQIGTASRAVIGRVHTQTPPFQRFQLPDYDE